MRRESDYQVFASTPRGQISGVDVFSAHLVRGLHQRGIPTRVLLTQPDARGDMPLPFPSDVPSVTLEQPRRDDWPRRWRALGRFLEEQAPCIYLPNYDFEHSCISPRLSEAVRIVGIVHSDDPMHYDHVQRLGRYWNLVVAVSGAIAERTAKIDPSLQGRLTTVPYGVPVADRLSKETAPGRPLEVVYAGRLVQTQKRVHDLVKVMHATAEHGAPVRFTVIGAGSEAGEMRRACAVLVDRGVTRFAGPLPNAEVLEVFARSDAFVLTSAFEGLPVSLLEAMGRGCVPIVSDVQSGIPELIRDGFNGFRVPIGDIQQFAARIVQLQSQPARRLEMAQRGHETVRRGYSLDTMAERYIGLFEQALRQSTDRTYRRPRGRILPPPWIQPPTVLRGSVRRAARFGIRVMRGVLAASGRSR